MTVTINGTGTGVFTDASGNFSVRTATPTAPVTVGRVDSSNEGGQIDLCRASDNASSWAIDVYGNTSTPSFRIVDNVAAAARMVIDGSGNVGIGTSSPQQKLQVYSSAASGGQIQVTNASTGATSTDGVLFGYDGSNDVIINNQEATALKLYTSGSERARITSGGFLGINTTNPGYQLTVQTSTATSFGIVKTGSGGWARENYIAPNAGVYYFDYFATYTSPTQLGYISSNGTTMTYGTSSDVRMKENIVDAPSAMSDLSSIQIRSFDWKGQNVHQKYGVVAQELIEVAPDAVQKGQTEDDMWGVGYANLVPMLIKAVQEQQAQIEELKAKVAALEAK